MKLIFSADLPWGRIKKNWTKLSVLQGKEKVKSCHGSSKLKPGFAILNSIVGQGLGGHGGLDGQDGQCD